MNEILFDGELLESARLAEKPVIGLLPDRVFGRIIWPDLAPASTLHQNRHTADASRRHA